MYRRNCEFKGDVMIVDIFNPDSKHSGRNLDMLVTCFILAFDFINRSPIFPNAKPCKQFHLNIVTCGLPRSHPLRFHSIWHFFIGKIQITNLSPSGPTGFYSSKIMVLNLSLHCNIFIVTCYTPPTSLS